MRGIRGRALVAAIVAVAAAGAAAPVAPAEDPPLHLEPVGTFASPVLATAPPGDVHRLFVVEREGRIQLLVDGQAQRQPFLDIVASVRSSAGEQGLLGLAFAPDYAESGRLYVYLTNALGDIQIDEFHRATASPNLADPATRRTLLTIPHPTYENHNGGNLAFGPDGMLWAGTGDGGSGGDPNDNAQNLGVLLGKLLRIDPRPTGTAPYGVPSDNPFVGRAGARGEIWAYGLRNPWRWSFDRQTADLVIGDVGQNAVEEVDFLPAGRGAGANFGWRRFEGSQSYPSGSANLRTSEVAPVLEHLHSDGYCSITGGVVVRDPALAPLRGRYVYGDYCKAPLRSTVVSTDATATRSADATVGLDVSSLSSFGEDACGRVYAVSLAGPVRRLATTGECVPPPAPAPPPPSGDPGGGTPGGTPGSTPGQPAAAAPAVDASGPAILVSAGGRRAWRRAGLRVVVGCDEDCRATVTVRLAARRRVVRRRLPGTLLARLATPSRVIRLGTPKAFTAAVPRAVRRAALHVLGGGGTVRALVTVVAVDRYGNRSRARRAVDLLT